MVLIERAVFREGVCSCLVQLLKGTEKAWWRYVYLIAYDVQTDGLSKADIWKDDAAV